MTASPTKKSLRFNWRRLLKISGIICGVLFVLLVIAYFVVTSSGFFKGVILSKVSEAMGADITVSDASIHPFSGVVLSDLKVQVKGEEPLLTAKEIRANYSLWSIIRGNIVVSEVAVVSPVISVITKPDGSSNLPKPPPQESSPKNENSSASTATPYVDIKKVAITGATVRNTQQFKDGKSNIAEITDFNFSIENIKNGQTAKLAIRFDATVANSETNLAGLMNASSTGEFSIAFDDSLKPATVSGGLQLNVTKATGALADLAALTAQLQTDISPTEIKNLSLSFQRNDVKLGEVCASGPFDLAKSEGHLDVVVSSIDKQVLNLAGAASGMDFGTTTINSTNHIDVTSGGAVVAVAGRFDLAKFQITRARQTTPTLDITANYDATVDLKAKTGLVRVLTLGGEQNRSKFLSANLDKPMNLSWGETAGATGDSTLNATLSDFNLADWKPFLGDMASSGTVNATVKLLSQDGGKKLVLDLSSAIENLSTLASVNINGNASVQYDLSSVRADFKMTNLKVKYPSGQVSKTPLEARIQLDTSLAKQIADVRQFQITLTPTSRAKNEINFTGRVDMTKPNVFQGGLKLTADSLDLTTCYDLFAGQTNAVATSTAAAPAPTTTPPPAQPETEPAAMALPFQNFLVEANIGKIYLREVEIANFKTSVKLDSDRVQLNPFTLSLNEGPITANADVNVGVPGYKYDVSFDANKVPLTPLVNTFMPDRKGQIGGTAIARGHILGAGITGANLQKNLNGQFNISTTNMNLALANVHSPILRTVINVVAAIPELLRNPVAGLKDAFGNLVGGKSDTGFIGKLMSAPLDSVVVVGKAGGGKVALEKASVQSRAFLAEAPGDVTLDKVLMNSAIDFPVTVSLGRSLAEQLNMASTNTNEVYSSLGQIVTLTGTLQTPKSTIHYAVLGKIAVNTGSGILNAIEGGSTNSTSQKVIKGVGGLLDNIIKKK